MLRACMGRDAYLSKTTEIKEKEMALEMKAVCERCEAALIVGGVAYICSYECTFCASCTEKMNAICQSCGGELVLRPRRDQHPTSPIVAGV
jgi:hypothetical protein